ncbi:tail fiber assembly protein [Stenotrophomonas maltophilia]|uniref:tail fiber assembly protein n=1 Tax=Stenotrophomonas maltophilia TaxID=40324 RepID=UPI00192E5358
MNDETYAVSGTGFRRISADAELQGGEVRADTVPPAVLNAIQAAQGRAMRTALLRGSDWTQAPDSPLEPQAKAAWAVYRQELRDLPERADFPNCAWPAPPALPEGAAGLERPPLHI